MADPVELALDFIALAAVGAFTLLSLSLANRIGRSGLRRGFLLAGFGGLVHLSGAIYEILGDLSLVESSLPLISAVFEAVAMVLLAFAVKSFYPSWFASWTKKSS